MAYKRETISGVPQAGTGGPQAGYNDPYQPLLGQHDVISMTYDMTYVIDMHHQRVRRPHWGTFAVKVFKFPPDVPP